MAIAYSRGSVNALLVHTAGAQSVHCWGIQQGLNTSASGAYSRGLTNMLLEHTVGAQLMPAV